jgi:hypothetical protein
MRRTFGFLPSTIALIVVALLASSGSFAVPVARTARVTPAEVQTSAHSSVAGTNTHASEPDAPGRAAFLRAQAVSIARTHASHAGGSDGARHAIALGAERALLDLAARRVPGAAVAARQDGVTPPGQPAPSSRAPPIG